MLAMRLRGTPRTASASRARRGGRKKTSLMEQFRGQDGRGESTYMWRASCVRYLLNSRHIRSLGTPSAIISPALGPKAARQRSFSLQGDPRNAREGGKTKDAPMMCTPEYAVRLLLDEELDLALGVQVRLGARSWRGRGTGRPYTARPSFFRSCSVFPTHATSGCVYTTLGIVL